MPKRKATITENPRKKTKIIETNSPEAITLIKKSFIDFVTNNLIDPGCTRHQWDYLIKKYNCPILKISASENVDINNLRQFLKENFDVRKLDTNYEEKVVVLKNNVIRSAYFKLINADLKFKNEINQALQKKYKELDGYLTAELLKYHLKNNFICSSLSFFSRNRSNPLSITDNDRFYEKRINILSSKKISNKIKHINGQTIIKGRIIFNLFQALKSEILALNGFLEKSEIYDNLRKEIKEYQNKYPLVTMTGELEFKVTNILVYREVLLELLHSRGNFTCTPDPLNLTSGTVKLINMAIFYLSDRLTTIESAPEPGDGLLTKSNPDTNLDSDSALTDEDEIKTNGHGDDSANTTKFHYSPKNYSHWWHQKDQAANNDNQLSDSEVEERDTEFSSIVIVN